MNTSILEDPDFNIVKRQFLNFFEKNKFYVSSIEKMIADGRTRLIINLNDLRAFEYSLAKRLLTAPIKLIPPAEAALNEIAKTLKQSAQLRSKAPNPFKVGFEGSFGDHLTTPIELNSSYLTKMVCIEGIVTKLSLVRPKRQETVHYCEKTKKFSSMMYRDGTSFQHTPTGLSIPSKDADGNLLQIEFGYSNYIDSQKLFLQDMPERTEAGQMPRNVEIIVEKDLVDGCKAGDRVQVIGVFRAMAWKAAGSTSGLYRTLLIANNIRVISQVKKNLLMTEKDIKNIKSISKRTTLLDIFARSVAPNLYGHEIVKKAIVLLLLGGVEKNLENKTHIRGDINMLLLGDPSVGKSQLLRAIMQIAKLSISTTGKGSTGVGLTAAVLKDRDTGERYLEAGATVLADRGVICIDEFDKMSEMDRTSIHEVMEQQTVTIAKAGVHTSLNARCSVVAAANPVYSNYDQSKSPQQNIPLPDSILSRFDVLFIVLDDLASEKDRKVADHVLRIHRYNKDGQSGGDIFDQREEEDDIEDETEIYQKFDPLLHDKPYVEVKIGSNKNKKVKRKNRFLTLDFIRKYFEFAKKTYEPTLTDKAVKKICESYCVIRNSEETMTLPITARYVETIIRFATAHAKLRLSDDVEEIDVEEILDILYYSLHNKIRIRESDENKENIKVSRKRVKNSLKVKKKDSSVEEVEAEIVSEKIKSHTEKGKNSDEKRKKAVIEVISRLTRKEVSEVSSEEVKKTFNKERKEKEKELNKKELKRILKELESSNRIMVIEGTIHRI